GPRPAPRPGPGAAAGAPGGLPLARALVERGPALRRPGHVPARQRGQLAPARPLRRAARPRGDRGGAAGGGRRRAAALGWGRDRRVGRAAARPTGRDLTPG